MTDQKVSTSFPPFRILIIVLQALVLFVLLKYYGDILWPKLFQHEKPAKESHRKGRNMATSTQPHSQTFGFSDKSYLPSGILWTRARTGALKLWTRFQLRRAWNEPLILKFLCFQAMIFTQIFRLATSYNYWLADDKALKNLASSPTWILDLCFSVCLWLTFEFYTLSILNRFLRVEMILAQSKTYKIIRIIKYSFSIAFVTCMLLDIFEKVLWVYFFDFHVSIRPIVLLTFGIFKSLTGLLSVLLEMVVDVRMIFTSLAVHLATDRNINGNQGFNRGDFQLLKYQMITLFILLAFLSLSAVALLVYGPANLPNNAGVSTFYSQIDYATLSIVLIGYHMLLGYALMDLFLAQLKSAKKQIKLQRMNQSRTEAPVELIIQHRPAPSVLSARPAAIDVSNDDSFSITQHPVEKDFSAFEQGSCVSSVEGEDELVEAESCILLEKRRQISFWDIITVSRK